jgi:methylisocitrate lyase
MIWKFGSRRASSAAFSRAIIARTDAVWATRDPQEAQRRVRAFTAAGADMVFPTGATPEMIAGFRSDVPARYVVIDGPGHPRFAGRETAASLVLYYGFSLFAATRGLTAALGRFRADPAAGLDDLMEPFEAFEDRLGYRAFTDRARRYHPQ